MRRLFTFGSVLLALAGFGAGCAAKNGSVLEFDNKVDERIQAELVKRGQLVQGNPAYLALVNELDQGRKLLLSGKAAEAFSLLDKILENPKYINYPEYSYAKYYIANALYDLGDDYGALLYFVDIVRKEPLKIHTHESLRRSIAIAQKLKDDELVLYLASSITRDKVPRSLQEEFRYFIAKALYKNGVFDKPLQLLSEVSAKNRLYLAAQYLMGTIAVEREQFTTAIRNFQKISERRDNGMVYYEDDKITQLANLALGRIYYHQKNFPLSIVFYKKVKRDGEFFPQALYESGWALFKLNKFSEALSVLQSLNSPFFKQVYFLKSYLLRGAILLELCYYEDAVATLTVLEDKFGTLKTQIDRFAREARDPKDYYPILNEREKSPEMKNRLRFESLFRLAAANRDFLGVHRYIRRLQVEEDSLKALGGGRARLLSKLLAQKRSELMAKASYLAGNKLLLTRQMIEDFAGLKDIVRLEIVTAERNILQKRSLGLAPPVIGNQDLIRPEFTESLKESLQWWDWNGEYWRDEVGFYLMNLKTRCKDEEAPAK